jgi:hypothetical protein
MKTKLIVLLILLVFLAAAAGSALAKSSTASINWQVLSSGGAPVVSGSGNLTLTGSLGQTASGPASTNQTLLGSGFWYGVKKGTPQIFLPKVVR